jgi:hypothetical protein
VRVFTYYICVLHVTHYICVYRALPVAGVQKRKMFLDKCITTCRLIEDSPLPSWSTEKVIDRICDFLDTRTLCTLRLANRRICQVVSWRFKTLALLEDGLPLNTDIFPGLARLVVLATSINMLTRDLQPRALCLISCLELRLDPAHQDVHERFATLLSFNTLPALKHLFLPNGLPFHPQVLHNCPSLESLWLCPPRGYICGVTCPTEWAVALASLVQLTGLTLALEAIPQEFTRLGELVSLSIQCDGRGLSGVVGLTRLTALTWVATQYCQGVVSSTITTLPYLARLCIPHLELSKGDILSVAAMPSLTAIHMAVSCSDDLGGLEFASRVTTLSIMRRSPALTGLEGDLAWLNCVVLPDRIGMLVDAYRRVIHLHVECSSCLFCGMAVPPGSTLASVESTVGSSTTLRSLEFVAQSGCSLRDFPGMIKPLTLLTALTFVGMRCHADYFTALATLPWLQKLRLHRCPGDPGGCIVVEWFAPLASHMELGLLVLRGTCVLKVVGGKVYENDPKEIENVLGVSRRARGWPSPRVLMQSLTPDDHYEGWRRPLFQDPGSREMEGSRGLSLKDTGLAV